MTRTTAFVHYTLVGLIGVGVVIDRTTLVLAAGLILIAYYIDPRGGGSPR